MPNYVYPKQMPVVQYRPPPESPAPPTGTAGGQVTSPDYSNTGINQAFDGGVGMQASGYASPQPNMLEQIWGTLNNANSAINNGMSHALSGLNNAGNAYNQWGNLPPAQGLEQILGGLKGKGEGEAGVNYAPGGNQVLPGNQVPPGGDPARQSTQNAANKNAALSEQAAASGNTKELERLQAEWDRIAPLAAQYGISRERLANSYMQTGNPAAFNNFAQAVTRAHADDSWGNQATIAFGRAPNQLEWDEHWRAMNVGGRDPLEGHPGAIQNMQAQAEQERQQGQDELYKNILLLK